MNRDIPQGPPPNKRARLVALLTELVELVAPDETAPVAATEPEKPLTTKQIAAYFGESEDAAYKKAKTGEYPSFEISPGRRRFLLSQVLTALAAQAKPTVRAVAPTSGVVLLSRVKKAVSK